MFYPNPYLQPQQPMQRVTQIEQPLMPVQQNVQCFSVSNKAEMENVQVMPNVMYVGINLGANEIYIKRMNNDAIVNVKTYKQEQTPAPVQKTDDKLLSRLDELTHRLEKLEQTRAKGEKRDV